ncbi:N-acyl homoserine lactonase family protein [Mobilibacterium timonense]|uniref:N-acyl homoserine lactonase family protein n=1 Tax=Mobilibacterium timonense TaxID=1871012 RepID=UPI0023533EB9|nr:N-acyl homoserine lactonase family protein [Mobilibacterium timonense]MBM6991112.1 N-acyl homoserine lactonase family protein [Mobilibacterium timonense]
MKITVIQTGSTLVSGAVPDRSSHKWKYAYTGLFQKRKNRISVPVKAFLVEVGGHRILVDTGWSAACVTHPVRHMGFNLWFASEPVVTGDETVPSQLAAMGLKPEDLDAVILTHLDCDHASGLDGVAEAGHIFCSKEEWAHAQTRDVRYRPSFWKGVSIETLNMSDDPEAPFGKSCDLFSDGSIMVVLTPGHSEGSVAVLAGDESGYAAFIGDDSYNRHSWEEQKLPGPVFDVDAMRTTLRWVRELSHDPRCIGIYAAHDPEQIMPGR